MPAHVIRGDARHLPLAPNSVDCVVTSPPYWSLRSYQDNGQHYAGQIGSEPSVDAYLDALLDVTRECVRVLKPTGSLWVNLGDKYSSGGRTYYDLDPGRREVAASRADDGARPKTLLLIPQRYAIRCTDELGLICRAEVVWEKPNGLPESANDRVRRSHETWFHLTPEPHYYSAVDNIREPHDPAYLEWIARYGGRYAMTTGGDPNHPNAKQASFTGQTHQLDPRGKLPGSVRTIPTGNLRIPEHLGIKHHAAYPVEWPRWIITGWSPPGGLILDPFGGTGTTALAATVLGRVGVSVDASADYCRAAEWRTTDLDQLAKAAGVERSAAAREADTLDMEPLFTL